jgi:hypothetical protein
MKHKRLVICAWCKHHLVKPPYAVLVDKLGNAGFGCESCVRRIAGKDAVVLKPEELDVSQG